MHAKHCPPNISIAKVQSQTFKERLVDVMDQAQHFGALGAGAGGVGQGQAGEDFREGLDATERERTPPSHVVCIFHIANHPFT